MDQRKLMDNANTITDMAKVCIFKKNGHEGCTRETEEIFSLFIS
jgi:hypothetical protein